MKRTDLRKEQIIRTLREHEAGVPVAAFCRKHGVIDATIYNGKPVRRDGGLRGQAAEDAGGREHAAESAFWPIPCWAMPH